MSNLGNLLRYIGVYLRSVGNFMNPFWIYQQIYKDPLGCKNGRTMRRDLEANYKLYEGQERIVVYAFDVGWLKTANDVLGEEGANEVLRLCYHILIEVFEYLRTKWRAKDPLRFGVYREHGDEFVAWSVGINPTEVLTVLEEVLRAYNRINQTYILGEKEGEISDYATTIVEKAMQRLRKQHPNNQYPLPRGFPVHMTASCVIAGENPYEAINMAINGTRFTKNSFYEKHPELDPRKNGELEKSLRQHME